MNKLSKNKKIGIIITAILVVALIIGSYYFYMLRTGVIYGFLGQTVTLKKGQEYKIVGKDISVKIKGFDNNPCPEDVQCAWSGTAVYYKLIVNGVEYDDHGGGYSIWTKESNYTNYAKLSVIREED